MGYIKDNSQSILATLEAAYGNLKGKKGRIEVKNGVLTVKLSWSPVGYSYSETYLVQYGEEVSSAAELETALNAELQLAVLGFQCAPLIAVGDFDYLKNQLVIHSLVTEKPIIDVGFTQYFDTTTRKILLGDLVKKIEGLNVEYNNFHQISSRDEVVLTAEALEFLANYPVAILT